MNFLQTIKPRLPKRYLLFVAALVWTFAGSMLLFKGLSFFTDSMDFLWIRGLISITGGLLFYWLLFSKISRKHTWRIINLQSDKPCLFSFFSIKSYILMSAMITLGILLRKSGFLNKDYLAILYVTMGIPLFLSAFRFYYFGIYYRSVSNLN
jgi:hypothetical protein